MIEKWMNAIYDVEKIVRETSDELIWMYVDDPEPTIFRRIPQVEKQIEHTSYIYHRVDDGGIDAFISLGNGSKPQVFFINLYCVKEEVVIHAYQIEENLATIYKEEQMNSFKDLLYDYFISQPAYRLKEATGLLRRREDY